MDEKLRTPQAAARVGVTPNTWSSYVSRGQAPKPDGEYDARTPWWYASTVDKWNDERPGRGGPGRTRKPRAEPDA